MTGRPPGFPYLETSFLTCGAQAVAMNHDLQEHPQELMEDVIAGKTLVATIPNRHHH